jgi:hypothetical protein
MLLLAYLERPLSMCFTFMIGRHSWDFELIVLAIVFLNVCAQAVFVCHLTCVVWLTWPFSRLRDVRSVIRGRRIPSDFRSYCPQISPPKIAILITRLSGIFWLSLCISLNKHTLSDIVIKPKFPCVVCPPGCGPAPSLRFSDTLRILLENSSAFRLTSSL